MNYGISKKQNTILFLLSLLISCTSYVVLLKIIIILTQSSIQFSPSILATFVSSYLLCFIIIRYCMSKYLDSIIVNLQNNFISNTINGFGVLNENKNILYKNIIKYSINLKTLHKSVYFYIIFILYFLTNIGDSYLKQMLCLFAISSLLSFAISLFVRINHDSKKQLKQTIQALNRISIMPQESLIKEKYKKLYSSTAGFSYYYVCGALFLILLFMYNSENSKSGIILPATFLDFAIFTFAGLNLSHFCNSQFNCFKIKRTIKTIIQKNKFIKIKEIKAISASSLCVLKDEEFLIKELDFSIHEGSIIGITGSCEKIKIFRDVLIAKEKPSKGGISINHYPVENIISNNIVLHDNYQLLIGSTIKENIQTFNKISDENIIKLLKSLDVQKKLSTEDDKILGTIITKRISQNVMKLISIARLLSTTNRIIIIEDLFSNFDKQDIVNVFKLFRSYVKKNGFIFIEVNDANSHFTSFCNNVINLEQSKFEAI